MTDRRHKLLEQRAASEDATEDAVLEYAQFCQRQRCPERALPHLQRLIGATRGREARARLLLALGQLNETKRDYRVAAEAYAKGSALAPSAPQVRYFLCNNEGFCLNQLGAYALAEFCVRAAIEIDPERHNAYKNLGVSLEGRGRYAEAAEAFVRAVEAGPRDRRALNHLEKLVEREGALAASAGMAERLERCRRLVSAARPDVH